jgi:acyl-CoA thioesterase-1
MSMLTFSKIIAMRPAAPFYAVLLFLLALPGRPSVAAARTGDKVVIAILGDSLTAGYGLAVTDAFPARLEAALRRSGIAATVIDSGVSGDTTAGGRARLDWLLQESPDLLLIELGANDALRALDPAQAEANLDAILATARKHGIPVLLTGMHAPRNLGSDYVRRFEAIYPRLAKKYAVELYPFFLEGVAGVAELNQGDGLHPNARGVQEIVRRMLPQVRRLAEDILAGGKKPPQRPK